jgi:membrane protein DedA with SNARE-associated domain
MSLPAVAFLVGLLFVKEAGLPIPVPGDLLVVGAGAAWADSGPAALAGLCAILLAGWAGGFLQFVIVRGILRERVIGLLVRAGLPRGRLDALAAWLAGRGARGVAVARLTPGIRVGAIAASGLAGLRSSAFIPGLVVGNGAFVGGHFLLGLAVGRPALELLDRLGPRASAAIAAVAILAVAAAAGALAWRLLARRRAGLAAGATGGFAAVEGRGSGAAGTGRSAFEAWADAACPACVALAFRIGDERVMAIPAPVEARR